VVTGVGLEALEEELTISKTQDLAQVVKVMLEHNPPAQAEIKAVAVEEKVLPEVPMAPEVLDLTHGLLGQQLRQLVRLVIMLEAVAVVFMTIRVRGQEVLAAAVLEAVTGHMLYQLLLELLTLVEVAVVVVETPTTEQTEALASLLFVMLAHKEGQEEQLLQQVAILITHLRLAGHLRLSYGNLRTRTRWRSFRCYCCRRSSYG